MKIAIVHDYLHQFGGAEKVVEKWLEFYPEADVYTSIYTPDKFESSPHFEKARKENRIHTSFAQKIIANSKMIGYFKHFFWLYPIAMSKVKVEGYDAVLISSTYCGKNVKLKNNTRVIHYCHSPTRFLHGLVTETDHASLSKAQKLVVPLFKSGLKKLDLKAVKHLNDNDCTWVGNSKFIQETIKDVYNVDSELIYPPIDLERFMKVDRKPLTGENEYYLSHGRVSFHKRVDLAILACMQLGKKLKISGNAGSDLEMNQLKDIVKDYEKKHPESKGLIEFLGRTEGEVTTDLAAGCKAFLFPGKEDFGISPVEMLAAGVPVIAYKEGGALEYVQENINGVFFHPQTTEELIKGIKDFESKNNWDADTIKRTSAKFSEEMFKQEIDKLVKG